MSRVLYSKYGSNDLSNMGSTLQAGQDAMTRNFKGVLADVDGLLKTVEKGYIEDNTRQLQDYLRTTIKNAGLAAEAPEMDQITGQFGKLLDKDVLGKTIADTRARMLTDATDKAGIAAGTDFSENEDLGSATGAFKKSLLALGMKDSDATAEATKWRQNNTYLAEDVELNNAALVNDFGNEVLNTLKSHQGKVTAEEVINNLSENVPEKLRHKAIMSAREMIEQRSKLTTEQQEEHDYIKGTVNQRLAEFDSQQALKASAASAAVAKYDSINPTVAASAAKLAADNPSGIMKTIAEDAGSWFGGLFGRLDGQEVSRALQPQVTSLIREYGVPAADAYAIALQAYQEARADGGEAWIGSGSAIDPNVLQERVHDHLSQWSAKQEAIKAQNAVLLSGVTERARLLKAGEELTHSILKGERFSNIDGKPFDSQAVFKKSLFGGGESTLAGQPATVAPAAVIGKKAPASAPMDPFAAALARAKQAPATSGTVTPPVTATPGKPATPGKGATGSWGGQTETEKTFMQKLGSFLTKDIYAVPEAKASTRPATKTAKPVAKPIATSAAKPAPGETLSAQTDVRRGIVAGYDMGSYATHPKHVANLSRIRKSMPKVSTEEAAENYIRTKFPKSPITGAMVLATARKYGVEPEMVLTVAEQDSSMGTQGRTSIRNNNPGNVGGDGPLNNRYATLQDGMDAIGEQLQRRKVKPKARR